MRTIEIIKALADPTRARILFLLMHRGPELCVCDLVAVLGLPQSTISRQLTMLRHLDLVNDRRAGVWMHYSVAPPASKAHQLALDLVRQGLQGEPQPAVDLKRFDELRARRRLSACWVAPQGRIRKSRPGGVAR